MTERTLTKKGEATRQRIVAGAANLIRARGVANVGLDDIRQVTSTSKSQLFHYFPDGKAELLRAVAVHEAQQVLDDQQPFLGALDSAKAWRSWRDVVVAKYTEQGDRCPLAALTGQLGPGDPATKSIVADLLDRWQAMLADGVRASGAVGEPDRLAGAILAAVQGGVVMLQATGRPEHLALALDQALEAVLG